MYAHFFFAKYAYLTEPFTQNLTMSTQFEEGVNLVHSRDFGGQRSGNTRPNNRNLISGGLEDIWDLRPENDEVVVRSKTALIERPKSLAVDGKLIPRIHFYQQ